MSSSGSPPTAAPAPSRTRQVPLTASSTRRAVRPGDGELVADRDAERRRGVGLDGDLARFAGRDVPRPAAVDQVGEVGQVLRHEQHDVGGAGDHRVGHGQLVGPGRRPHRHRQVAQAAGDVVADRAVLLAGGHALGRDRVGGRGADGQRGAVGRQLRDPGAHRGVAGLRVEGEQAGDPAGDEHEQEGARDRQRQVVAQAGQGEATSVHPTSPSRVRPHHRRGGDGSGAAPGCQPPPVSPAVRPTHTDVPGAHRRRCARRPCVVRDGGAGRRTPAQSRSASLRQTIWTGSHTGENGGA